MVKVKCIVTYNDLDLKRLVREGEELELTNERAKYLAEDRQLVEVIEVIPEKDTERKKPVSKKKK